MVGFGPISHMGHAIDLGGALAKLPGTKHIGISAKADLFSPEERKSILDRQWKSQNVGHEAHVVSGAGETIRKAYDSLPQGRKELHLLVGHDRAKQAESLKSAHDAGKLKEMEDKKFDKVHIHFPEDTDRKHGMSGTKMRSSVQSGDKKTFKKHLGPFTDEETSAIMTKIDRGLKSGDIAVDRNKIKKKIIKESVSRLMDRFKWKAKDIVQEPEDRSSRFKWKLGDIIPIPKVSKFHWKLSDLVFDKDQKED
jgi:hypothetical protein